MENYKPMTIPMSLGIKLEKESEKVNEHFYQEIIESFLYLSLYILPIIKCAGKMLLEFSMGARKQHLNSAYRIIRYLSRTING